MTKRGGFCVVNLIAKSPLWGQAPLVSAGVTLAEVELGQVASIAPFDMAVPGFPAPNKVVVDGATRLVWTGRGQAFLIGGPVGDWAEVAAVTDQSDGWAGMSLLGAGAVDVLARLVPVDLRRLAVGDCARSQLGHMAVIVIAVAGGFELLVFRSMAQTAWHELATAIKMRAARLAC
jgi:heterotetrameric sarcosine oxidase gamma subunit